MDTAQKKSQEKISKLSDTLRMMGLCFLSSNP